MECRFDDVGSRLRRSRTVIAGAGGRGGRDSVQVEPYSGGLSTRGHAARGSIGLDETLSRSLGLFARAGALALPVLMGLSRGECHEHHPLPRKDRS